MAATAGTDVVKALVMEMLCGHTERMRAAQDRLFAMGPAPGFGVTVCTILLDQSMPVAIRQYMGTILTRIVIERHWDRSCPGQGANGLVPDADKARIRELIPSALGDASSKIRTQVALVMAQIGNHDWPEEWPSLFDNLLACVRLTDAKLLHGALRCLSFFAPYISTDHIQMATERLSPELLRLFTSTTHSSRIRARALAIMKSCMATLGTMVFEPELDLATYTKSVLAKWLPVVCSALRPEAVTGGSDEIPLMALKFLFSVFTRCSRLVDDQADALVNGVFAFVAAIAPVYQRIAVEGGEGADDDGYDSEGEVTGLDMLATEAVSVVGAIVAVESDVFRKLVKDNLEALMNTVIPLTQITEEQRDAWESDANAFVTAETELWASATPRDVADDLIGEVLSMHGRRGVRAVSACIVANLKAAGVNLSAPSCPPSSWRMQEACLNVLTRVAQGLLIEAKRDASGDDAGKGAKGKKKKKKKKKPLPLTVESVLPYLTTCVSAMPHIATACQAAQAAGTSTDTILGMSFVLGRALSAVSRLAPAIPEAQCFVVLKAAIDGLADVQPVPIRVASCHALRSLCPFVSAAQLEPVMPAAVARVAAFAATATENLLVFVLSTLNVCMKATPSVAASTSTVLIPALIRLWQQFIASPTIVSAAQDVLATLATNERCSALLTAQLLPVLKATMLHRDAFPGTVEAALELVRSVVEHAATPFAPSVMEFLPLTCQLLLVTDDASAQQSGADLVASYIHRSPAQVQAWPGPDGQPVGVAKILEVAGRLLGPDVREHGAVYCPRLLTRLLNKLGSMLPVDVVSKVMALALQRLASAKTAFLATTLVDMFAHIILAHGAAVLPVLEGVTFAASAIQATTKCKALPDTVNGVVLLALVWNASAASVMGPFARKICFIGMSKFLSMPRVVELCGSMIVEGDMVPTPRRQLRSAAPKYQMIPLPVAMAVCVARGLLSEDEEDEWYGDMDDSDDDEFVMGMAAAHEELMAMGVINDGSGAGAGAGSPFAPSSEVMHIWDGLDDDDNKHRPFADGSDSEMDEDDIAMKDHPLFEASLAKELCTFFAQLGSGEAGLTPTVAGHILQGCNEALRPEERDSLSELLSGGGEV